MRTRPRSPAPLAVLAVKVAGVFLPGGAAGQGAGAATVAEAVVRAAEAG